MEPVNLDLVREFVNDNISSFHQRRIRILEEIELERVLKKNPYLFKAKAVIRAQDLIDNLLDAYLSSSEEELLGEFLEDLAIFISGQTSGGRKSAATGVDLEFTNEGITYLIAIKSGPNWGNSSQHNRLENDLRRAKQVLEQNPRMHVRTILGICYGKTKTSRLRGYTKVVGQEFWYLISGSEDLYMDIIEPIGHNAVQHNKRFEEQRIIISNRFTERFMIDYCDDGEILWKKLVFFVSNNMDKEKLPYGYYYDFNGIKIQEEFAEIVRRVFNLRDNYPQDQRQPSYKSIAELLNEEGYVNWVGNGWNSNNISWIIRNREMYLGGQVNDDETLPKII